MSGVIIANLTGFKSIVRTVCLVVPFTVASIVLTLFAVYNEFSFDKFSPFFGYNYKHTFLNGTLNIFSLYVVTYYYFLMPLLKDPNDFKKIAITSIVISSIYIFLSVICLIMMFPFIAFTDEMLSIYLLARLIEFGKFFQRVDAVFVLIWILSAFSFLAITLEFTNKILKKLLNLKTHKELSYSICAIIFSLALSLANISNIKFMQNDVLRYFVISLVFVLSLIILLLANLKYKKEKST
jgi:hypothetical protein